MSGSIYCSLPNHIYFSIISSILDDWKISYCGTVLALVNKFQENWVGLSFGLRVDEIFGLRDFVHSRRITSGLQERSF